MKPTDRLRREGQEADCTGQGTEHPIENLIVIGASAGGHHALKVLLKGLPKNIPAPVIIMQHMAVEMHSGLVPFRFKDWLSESTHIPIVLIRSGDRMRSGTIYIGPPGISVSIKGRVFELSPSLPGTHRAVPINRLFESAAHAFGDRVIGVVLTGLLKDGTDGLKAVHDAGGLTIVQDPTEAEYPDMPTSAMKDLPVTFCLSLADIGPTLDLLARRRTELETGLAVSVRMLKERLALLVRLIGQSKTNPATNQFLSTEVIALENDLRSIQALLDKVFVKCITSMMTDEKSAKAAPEAHKLLATFMSASAPIETYLQHGHPLTDHELELLSLTVSGLQTFLDIWKRRYGVKERPF
ncbi:MAG: chemotaxis protein CheB [Nitrospira sp.]|nr:chemotaxis protein CheB [Nitrospira sp.]